MNSVLRLALAVIVSASVSSPVAAAQYNQRLSNLSTRAQVGSGSNVMITGFVVQEGAPKRVLIRAVGARLASAPFSLTGVLSNPQLHLFNSAGVLVLANDNWLADDLPTMNSVGAFPLANNSADAALVATLSPGAYTAQVSGVNNTTGVAILEIYDVSGSARLLNLSTRALVGSGASTFFSGLVVAPSGGARRVLVRVAGPALGSLGVTGVLADPAIAVLDSAGRQIAGGANDNWDANGAGATLSAAFTQAGAFPFAAGSRDAALLLDLMPGNYVIQVNGVAGATGTALVELYDLSPETLATVSVAATVPTTDAGSATPAVFTFSRVGAVTSPITVNYTMSGSAVAGTDYTPLAGSVTIPAGETSATVSFVPRKNPENTNNRTATLTIAPNMSYGLGANDRASVTIFSNSGSLYISSLRAQPNATSTAYGTATIQLAPDESYAFVNVSFFNLSSPQVVAHLAIDGDYVFNLPQGQVSGAFWEFNPVGRYSRADLIAALKAGRVTVSIDTATYPAGELAGSFLRSTGVAAFNPPSAPPPLDLSRISQMDAARFLTQATFGATQADITALVQKGYQAWLAEQMALAPTSHRHATMEDFNRNQTNGGVGTRDPVTQAYPRPGGPHRQAAWWKIAVNAPDQLRQRVAFALSQILVISDTNGTISQWQEGAANYYDILAEEAFGNFRTLLERVSLSPMMGIYLSSLRNAKTAGGTTPDENYAREIMQLFTIGLHELNPDGTLRLDPNGQPIPTYTQETIVQTAKVFTGWAYANAAPNATSNANLFRGSPANYIEPMMLWPAFHDDTEKTIIGGKVLPQGQGGHKDLKDTLDALVNHPNTGPFISRQLIQRLVTSNPSSGYVYRVAQVFANNGAGVRGDLGAVVRAILLDHEARSSALASTPSFGKMKEPLLRATALFRAFGGASNSGRFGNLTNPEGSLAQAALRAPTVFNFFEPNFTLPGPIAEAGLYAPEYQILTDTTALTQPNYYYNFIYATRSTTDMNQQSVGLSLNDWLPLARTPAQLVDALNLLLASGALSKLTTDRITAAITAMPAGTATSTANDLERVRSAIYLTLTCPQATIQK